MNKALEMAGNMFTYENPRCDCKVTTNYTDEGVEYHGLKIKTNEGSCKYAYAPVDGLVMIDWQTGAIIKKHKVIENFLNIDCAKTDEIKEYIETYGFIIPLPNDGKYRTFSQDDFGRLINRFRTLVNLMAAIEEADIDYDNVLKLTAYLLFARQVTLNGDNRNDEGLCLYSCAYAFTRLWYGVENLPRRDAVFTSDYYLIKDSFTNKEEPFGTREYWDCAGILDIDSDADSSCIFREKIMRLYRDAVDENIDMRVDVRARYFIDYLYHLLQIGIEIDDVQEDGILRTNKKITDCDKFDDVFKSQLIFIAKNTIKEEFDFALRGIHPAYDIETMSPNWEIPNFLTALYFALFYTRPDYEIYRKCENPNCGRLFKVKTTNSRKRFHDDPCRNATSQRRSRKNKK